MAQPTVGKISLGKLTCDSCTHQRVESHDTVGRRGQVPGLLQGESEPGQSATTVPRREPTPTAGDGASGILQQLSPDELAQHETP